MFKRVKKNKKGFTLAELLIVVAIIALLVAISFKAEPYTIKLFLYHNTIVDIRAFLAIY